MEGRKAFECAESRVEWRGVERSWKEDQAMKFGLMVLVGGIRKRKVISRVWGSSTILAVAATAYCDLES